MVERRVTVPTPFESRLQSVRLTLREAGHELDWTLNAAASDAELSACETAIGRTLPEDYRAFLRLHNGASIAVDHEPGLSHDVYLFSTNEILEEHHRFVAAYRDLRVDGELIRPTDESFSSDRFWDGLIAFTHYGDGLCLFDVGRRSNGHDPVLDLDLEDTVGTRERVIASSFDDWLSRILSSAIELNGLVYWLPADESERA